MSNLILRSNDEQSTDFAYRGLTFQLRVVPDMSEYNVRLAEATVARGGSPDEYDKLDKESSGKAMAYAMIGTVVTGMTATAINGVAIKFDGPSEMSEYKTAGEEILAVNGDLRNAIFVESWGRRSSAPAYENVGEIAGNSSTPSASISELATLPDVAV